MWIMASKLVCSDTVVSGMLTEVVIGAGAAASPMRKRMVAIVASCGATRSYWPRASTGACSRGADKLIGTSGIGADAGKWFHNRYVSQAKEITHVCGGGGPAALGG